MWALKLEDAEIELGIKLLNAARKAYGAGQIVLDDGEIESMNNVIDILVALNRSNQAEAEAEAARAMIEASGRAQRIMGEDL